MKLWIIYTIVGMISYAVGEYFSKIYATSYDKTAMAIALFAYFLTSFFWFPALKDNNQLIVMTIIWTLGYLIIGSIIGKCVFNEILSVGQWIGFILSIIAVFLLIK